VNFPGLQPVLLQWSTGIPYTPPNPIAAADNGTFAVQFLVVSGDDVFGPRQLQASIGFVGATTLRLTTATTQVVARAPFTVVPHTAGPPTADIIHTLWGDKPFWFRH